MKGTFSTQSNALP